MKLPSIEYSLGALVAAVAALLISSLPETLPVELDTVIIIAFGLLAALVTPVVLKNGQVAVKMARKAYVDRGERTAKATVSSTDPPPKVSGLTFGETVNLCYDLGFGLVIAGNPSQHRALHVISAKSEGRNVEVLGESLFSGTTQIAMVVGQDESMESIATLDLSAGFLWFDEFPQVIDRKVIIAATNPAVVFISVEGDDGFITIKTIRLK